jgi:hypothetical protein
LFECGRQVLRQNTEKGKVTVEQLKKYGILGATAEE